MLYTLSARVSYLYTLSPQVSYTQVLHTLPIVFIILANAVYTAHSSFVFASLVCIARSSVRYAQVFYALPAQVCAVLIRVVYACPPKCRVNLPAHFCYAIRNCSPIPIVFDNDFISSLRHFGAGGLRSNNYSLAYSYAQIVSIDKRILFDAGSGASSPCSFAPNTTFSCLFEVLELGCRCTVWLSLSSSDLCSKW